MFWSSFLGALAGTFAVVALLVGALVIWDVADRKQHARQSTLTLERLTERDLQQSVVGHFAQLFPGWQLLNTEVQAGDAGRIDILAVDRQGSLVAIELKRGTAEDGVVAQTMRYINWLKRNLPEPYRKVKGLIIAKDYGNGVVHSLADRPDVDIWRYDWTVAFDKSYRRPSRRRLRPEPVPEAE